MFAKLKEIIGTILLVFVCLFLFVVLVLKVILFILYVQWRSKCERS